MLNIFQHYTVKFKENKKRITAQTAGVISDIDQAKLINKGWRKVNAHEFFFIKPSPPDPPDPPVVEST